MGGKYWDVESLYDYSGARYYDSRIGRWLSNDPLAELSPGGAPYCYGRNCPLVFVDPTGMRDTTIDGKPAPHVMPEVETVAERDPSSDSEPVPAHFVKDSRRSSLHNTSPQKLVETTGAIANMARYSQVRVGQWRSYKDGRYYSLKKHPNGITGSRKAVLADLRAAGYIASAADYILLACALEELEVALESGSPSQIMRAKADFVAASAGAVGGAIGCAYAVSYFEIIDILDSLIPYESPDLQDQIRCHGAYQSDPQERP